MTLTAMDETSAPGAQPHVTVLTDRCAGCQECVIRCPAGALTMDAGRWVAIADDALCVGCRQCERTCPFSAITVEGPLLATARNDPEPRYPGHLTGDTSEIRPGFGSWEEALAEANRCLECPDPTCVRGCPAHNDIPSFIKAIRDGDLSGAHDVLRRTSVLPDICSRVCDQAAQCEGACTWSLAGGAPVAIGKLERFVADHAPVPPLVPAKDAGTGLSVAVVGSGPAGIGAAWHLAEAGASVTVYERDPEPGGLLGWGIPDFTLPAAVSGRPWRQLAAAGVDLRCGVSVRALEGDADGRLRRARLSDGTTLDVDVAIAALGSRRNTEWLAGSGLAAGRWGVACDAGCRAFDANGVVTDNVFVAGDVARFPHPLYDYQFIALEHWGNAVTQAEVAAHNMVSSPEDLWPHLATPVFWSQQFGTNIKSVGVPTFADQVVVAQGSVPERQFVAAYGYRGRMTAAVSFDHGIWLDFYQKMIEAAEPFPPPFSAVDEPAYRQPLPAGIDQKERFHATVAVTGHDPSERQAEILHIG